MLGLNKKKKTLTISEALKKLTESRTNKRKLYEYNESSFEYKRDFYWEDKEGKRHNILNMKAFEADKIIKINNNYYSIGIFDDDLTWDTSNGFDKISEGKVFLSILPVDSNGNALTISDPNITYSDNHEVIKFNEGFEFEVKVKINPQNIYWDFIITDQQEPGIAGYSRKLKCLEINKAGIRANIDLDSLELHQWDYNNNISPLTFFNAKVKNDRNKLMSQTYEYIYSYLASYLFEQISEDAFLFYDWCKKQ